MNLTDHPVRFSHLKNMARSPAHYRAALDVDRKTQAMSIGKLCHSLVLGGDYVVFEGERRGNKWLDFKAANDGKHIVTTSEMRTAMAVMNSLAKHSDASRILKGLHEFELDWSMLGRKCQSHLDVLGPTHLADLKTCSDGEPGRFTRAALRYGYHAQLAFYQDAVGYNFGAPYRDAYIVEVETFAPFEVTVFKLTDRALEEGRKLCRIWMERLIGCEEVDEWPGYAQTILDLDIAEDCNLIIDGEEVAA